MNRNITYDPQQKQEYTLKRRCQEIRRFPNMATATRPPPPPPPPPHHHQPSLMATFPCLDDDEDDLLSNVIPPVTVVLEGRSICQRISLHKHASYCSLAKELRQMFADIGSDDAALSSSSPDTDDLDITNAIPGYLVAYEDMENDLLLAGDLNWKDFVRVAKRIRILPAKMNSRKGRGGA